MAVTAFKGPGTVSNVDDASGQTWSNTGNIAVSDNSYASVSVSTGGHSDYLRCSNFGFTTSDIPSGAIINGIEVTIEHRSVDTNNQFRDRTVILRNSGGQVGDNKASATLWTPANADVTFTYGGAADVWGTTLTDSDIRASTFGLDFSLDFTGAGFNETSQIDAILIRIYYTLPASPPPFTHPRHVFSKRRLR